MDGGRYHRARSRPDGLRAHLDDDPLNVIALFIVAGGTIFAVLVVLLAGGVGQALWKALRGLSGKGEATPPA
jgi:hypothetical protein